MGASEVERDATAGERVRSPRGRGPRPARRRSPALRSAPRRRAPIRSRRPGFAHGGARARQPPARTGRCGRPPRPARVATRPRQQLILRARALRVTAPFRSAQDVVENGVSVLAEGEHEPLPRVIASRWASSISFDASRLVTLAGGEHQLRNADPSAAGRVDDGIDFLDQRCRCVQLPFEHVHQSRGA